MSDLHSQPNELVNFTPRAQLALANARKEADRLNHHFVDSEHLLLGLISLGQGVAVNVLQKLGLNLEQTREEVQKQVGIAPGQKAIGNIPYTPSVRRVLARAAKEAKALNHSYVGTEHLLLGLLQEGDGVVARVFQSFKVDIAQTRQEILKELDPNFAMEGAKPIPHEKGNDSREPMNNFTPRAQAALGLARQQADRLHHNFAGTEHLLLGIIQLDQGCAVTVLQKMGLKLDAVRAEVEKQVGTGPDQKTIGNIPYTPRVKKVLAIAAKEAKALNHTYVGTEHLLLGLLQEGDGIAARVLQSFKVDIAQTRQEILKELDPNFEAHKETVPIRIESVSKQYARPPDSVDISKRYDVYCAERGQEVVYRNARFIARKALLPPSQQDYSSEFIELEQTEGQTIFIARASIIKFCEHISKPG